MDDAIAAGQAAVKAGKVESALNLPVGELGDAYHMEPILTSFGGYIFAYDEADRLRPRRTSASARRARIAAAEEISELAKQKVLRTSISGDNSIALFTERQGRLPGLRPVGAGRRAEGRLRVRHPAGPRLRGRGARPQPFMGAQAFMVAAHGAEPGVRPGVRQQRREHRGGHETLFDATRLPPAMTAVQEQVDDPDLAIFADAANAAAPMPAIPAMAAVWEPLGKAYSAIVGGERPDATMTAAGKTINEGDRRRRLVGPRDRTGDRDCVARTGRPARPAAPDPTRTTLRPRQEEQP